MIDLHTHSTASDGSLTPSRLMQAAKEGGLSAIALTDHDTIDGIEEASNAAEKLGLGFIPGVELEIRWDPGEFHLLGLGIRHSGGAFRTALDEISRRREARNLQILDRMQELSIEVSYDDIRAFSGGGSVGRPHFAAALVTRGLVRDREQAFSRFLGKGKPLYVPKEGLEFAEALELIKEAGGIAVLAHPMSLYVSWGRLPDLIKDLADQGLDGIEAWHPAAKVRACKRLEELGTRLGLFITAGSDFHGETRPDRKLGITAGGRKIEEAILEAIPPLKRRAQKSRPD
jgi:predicted metal-dependent phosphoesterase TrpH